MVIFQLYVHSPIWETVEFIYGWLVFPEVLKCVLNHTTDLSCKNSYLLQPDLMLTEADAIYSIISDAFSKFCIYIKARISQVGHQERYQPIIIQTNNKIPSMHHTFLADCSAVLESASFTCSKFCSSESTQFADTIILSFFFSKV